MQTRRLGSKGPKISALGIGTWAMGGPYINPDGKPLGWGPADDAESHRAIKAALDKGVTFFDTADVYGTGHAEIVLGRAVKPVRDQVVIATKWGNTFDPSKRQTTGPDVTPEYARRALTASLQRLGTDYIDLWQLHIGSAELKDATELRGMADALATEGLIRGYAWSTDDPERAALFAEGEHCLAVQHETNVFRDTPAMYDVCEKYGIASINRGPLAMGLLTGKFTTDSVLAADDVRTINASWFVDGRPNPQFLDQLEAVRDALTSDGRTLAQGAIGWLWARSPWTIPIPGVRTVGQTQDNVGALDHGPLSAEQFAAVETALGRA